MRNLFAAAILFILTANTLFAQENIEELRREKRARRSRPVVNSVYGLNLFHITEENIGLGINYERFIDNKGTVSIYLPLSYSLPKAYENTRYSYTGRYDYSMPDTGSDFTYTGGMGYFYPGIKVYPWGSNHKVSFAFGTSFVLGMGKADQVHKSFNIDTFTTNNLSYYTITQKSETKTEVNAYKMGVMLTGYMNLRPVKNWLFGLELGVGYSYVNRVDGKDVVMPPPVVQFGFKIAYAR